MNEKNPDQSGKIDRTISIARANILAWTLSLPVVIVIVVPYALIWKHLPADFINPQDWVITSGEAAGLHIPLSVWLLAGVWLVGMALHEALHGIGYLHGGATRSEVKFGFKSFSPYAHCKVPLNAAAYRLAVALPGVVLGVIPALLGLISGSEWLTIFALLNLLAALGDAFVLWMVRSVPNRVLLADHPSEVGCQIILT